MLRTYRSWNSRVGFSKYEFYNKLFGDVILLKVIPSTYIYTHTHMQTHTPLNTCFLKKKIKQKNNVFL